MTPVRPPDHLIDVAGIGVVVRAGTADHASSVASRLGRQSSGDEPEVVLEVGPVPPSPPAREPDQRLEGYLGWEEGDGVWIARRGAVLRVGGGSIHVGGPLDDIDAVDTFDNLLQFGIAVAVARADRLMIHGAVVARDGHGVALIGRSGVGKSTVAAAALLGGWDLLGDDLAVVHPVEPSIRSVARPPMFPAEIADRHGLEGEREKGGRRRVTLPVEQLHQGSVELSAVVAVAHGDEGGIERLPGGDPGVLDDALAVPPFRPVIRRQLAAAAAMVARPIFVLSHAADPERRVAVAQASLAEVLDAVSGE